MEDFLRIMLEDDDEEDDAPIILPNEGPVLNIDVENWKRLGEPEFQKQFRLTRETFEALLLAVGRHLENTNRILRKSKNERGLDVFLMMVLWYLATPDCFRSIGVKFGVACGSVHFHYKYIVEALREMAPRFIKWPNAFHKEMIAANFEDRYGYPSVIGCMDGCLIQISAPLEQPGQYVDWHRHYSITVQAVCDDRLLFRDVYVGEPGSVGDKRTFKRSPLGRKILEPEVMSDKILLGDGGYILLSKVMIPYRDDGNLTQRMRSHNYYLSRCRSCIERAFALLKNKWRRLKYFHCECIEYAVDSIMACLVLHNFSILEGQECEGAELEEADADPNYLQMFRHAKAEGIAVRDHIAHMLDPR